MKTPGLLGRSILASVLVAAVAVVATVLLTLAVTQNTLERRQVRVADIDRDIVTALLQYGRTHGSWNGAQGLLDSLVADDRRILLTDLAGNHLISSGGAPENTSDPSAVLEPLAAALAIVADHPPRSSRSLVLPASFRAGDDVQPLLRLDERRYPYRTLCISGGDLNAQWLPDDLGRHVSLVPDCDTRLTATETGGTGRAHALAVLNNDLVTDVHACLVRRGVASVVIRHEPDEGSLLPRLQTIELAGPGFEAARAASTRSAWRDCATASLTRRLGPTVAPQALLFLSEIRSAETGVVDRVGILRIAGALGAVLLAVVGASLFASRRVLRPVGVLTAATRRMAGGDLATRVPVIGSDEVADLGRSFNEMAATLAEAEEQRRRMVADIAHELRTPLANVRGYLEAGHDGVLDRDDSWTGSLLEEAGLLQHVVDDLQVLAEADAGRLSIHLEPVDLVVTVDLALQSLRATADAAQVRLRRAGADSGVVPHDRVRIRQLVANLVANAVRHSPAGTAVTVTVAMTAQTAIVTVRDHGPGVPDEHLPHVFERFYRADPSRSRETGGSGLGLAIVEQIASAHGGSVSVSNDAGGGATFTVELPTSPSGTSSAR